MNSEQRTMNNERRRNGMRKIFVFVGIITLVCVGCDDGGNSNENKNETVLTITNNSSSSIASVEWNGTNFADPDKNFLVTPPRPDFFRPGGKLKAEVDPGNGYIYFSVYLNSGRLSSGRIQELIIMEKGESKTFVFIDSTVVVESNKTYTLLEFVSQ
jgi:hypothetical protein